MAWHSTYSKRVAPCMLALAIACTDDGGNDTGAVTTVASDGSAANTSGASTSAATMTAATETSATSAASSGDASTADASTAADSTTGPGEPVECGDAMCNPGEVCVVPCCGGPQPACFELPMDGDCGNGTPDPGGISCCENDPDPKACMMLDWCIPGPCIPDPVFCAPPEMISCVPDDPTNCSVRGGCFGDLLDGQLLCRGCK